MEGFHSDDASQEDRIAGMDRVDVERVVLECAIVNELLQRASIYLDDLMAAVSDMADDDITSLVRDACRSIDRALVRAEEERDR